MELELEPEPGNFSKVGTGTGSGTLTFSKVGTENVKNSYGSTTLVALHSSNSNAGMKQYECGRTQPLL
jgi:hypothetical protein